MHMHFKNLQKFNVAIATENSNFAVNETFSSIFFVGGRGEGEVSKRLFFEILNCLKFGLLNMAGCSFHL